MTCPGQSLCEINEEISQFVPPGKESRSRLDNDLLSRYSDSRHGERDLELCLSRFST